MNSDDRFADEEGRLSALRRFCVLDTCNEEKFDRITSIVQTVLEVPIAAVSFIDNDRQWFKSAKGMSMSETPRSISFCDHAIRSASPLRITDALLDARFRDNLLVRTEPQIRVYLGAPLRTAEGYNVGALCAIDTRPRDFSAEQAQLLTKFAGLVVDELELRQLADRDHLTGAMTRRAFLNRLEMLRQSEDHVSALALFDLDHFKKINDTFGHPAGDQVLSNVAKVCQKNLRRGDCFGRLGGEEFGLLMTDLPMPDALRRVEAIRSEIARLSFEFSRQLKVTASFGLVGVDVKTSGVAIAVADAALYWAKKNGRNQVRTSSELLMAA